MKRSLLVMMMCLGFSLTVMAQNSEPTKFEVAAEFATAAREGFSGTSRADAGVGARFTFNFNRNVALESSGYLFPQRCFDCLSNGRATQVFAGVKAGKRFNSWGVFLKARPGVVSYSEGASGYIPSTSSAFLFEFQKRRLTTFASDVGGVLEFYPSKRIVTRFDAGDVMVFYRRRTFNAFSFDPIANSVVLVERVRPASVSHNFQFTASVGFRF